MEASVERYTGKDRHIFQSRLYLSQKPCATYQLGCFHTEPSLNHRVFSYQLFSYQLN